MKFKERYNHLLIFKHPDVEEMIDMFFHRPAAAVFAATIYSLPITPNHVTYLSLVAGWTGSLVMYDVALSNHYFDDFGYILAAILFLVSVVLDCADGQIARAKGGGTRMGRIVDGLVDALVVISLYIVFVIDIANRYGSKWAMITAAAGISMWVQVGIYDKVKAVYMSRTTPSGADGNESMAEVAAAWDEIKLRGTIGEKVGMFIYFKILLQIQYAIAPGTAAVDPETLTQKSIEAFRRKFSSSQRVCTFLGLGTHMLFIYCAVFLAAFWPPILLGLQILFLTVFNLILIYALLINRKMSNDN